MTDPTQALADMRATAAKGEVAGDWNNVVSTYKRAGQQVTVVGPAPRSELPTAWCTRISYTNRWGSCVQVQAARTSFEGVIP